MDKETEKMFEILHENKERERTKEIIEKQILEDKERFEKERKAQRTRSLIIGIILIIVAIFMIILMANEDKNFVEKCVNNGLSETVCRKAS